MDNVVIRSIKDDELAILTDLLYEAIFQKEDKPSIDRCILENSHIKQYIENFGKRQGDCCFVAEVDNRIIGGVWTRILAGEIRGYGNIDNETPEFAISLFKEYRNRGIGSLLMQNMIDHLISTGYKQASLSVNKANYAFILYEKLGFEVIQENEDDFLMLLKLEQ